MALLRDLLIWMLVSFHVVGGAALFRRFFPRESVWYAFLLPSLAVVILLNFIEHFVALPVLGWVLPLSVAGLAWAMIRPGYTRAGLGLPTVVFLLSFGYSFAIRAIDPQITSVSDGGGDLMLVSNFCHGDTLPPTDSWMPPLKLQWYYTLQQYGASIIKRLLNVDVGTAYNTAHTLLIAFTYTAAAAIAHRLSGQRKWVPFVSVFLVMAAFNGSTAYIWLTVHNATAFISNNLSSGFELMHDGVNNNNPLWHFLGFDNPVYTKDSPPERLELQVAGFWNYRNEFHANSSGHFLTLLAVFTMIELLRREERTVWPWIMSVLIPPLVALSSLWLIFADGFLCLAGLITAACLKLRPARFDFVVIATVFGVVLMWPAFSDIVTSPQSPSFMWTHWEWHTPITEYLVQWWPVLILWLALFTFWREVPLGARLVALFLPPFLVLLEMVTLEDGRYNTVEKMWGAMYSAGLLCFFPLVVIRWAWPYRLMCLVILFCGAVSLQGWVYGLVHWAPWGHGSFHLQGDSFIQDDPQKARIENFLRQYHDATILPGRAEWNYSESASLPIFTGNRCYVACYYAEDRFGHDGQRDRAQRTNDFYDDKLPDPLAFLRDNHVAAVVIWPDDAISDATLASLKQKLAPTYDYQDCRGDGDHNAGIFLGPTPDSRP